jgi:tetratricopeptide (TPR) repeat protein
MDMKNYLVSHQGWNSSNIEVKQGSNATANNILNYISSMPNTRGTSELFYYAGHGTTLGLHTYDGNISPSQLQNAFGSNYNQYCCILEACKTGVFVNEMTKGEILSAVKSFETASPFGPDNKSVYTYFILKGLQNNNADNVTGHAVSSKELHNYAKDKTTDWAWNQAEPHEEMHPQYGSNLGVFNFHDLKTVSGTLIDDELWDNNINLSNNVIVPTGKTLQILSGVNLNTGSYSVSLSGGTLNKESGVLGIKATLKSGSTLKGIYSSIQAACNNASSGDVVEVESCTLNENISVPTGVTLTIKSGATVSLNNFYIKSTGGTLNKQGTISDLKTYLKLDTTIKGFFSSIGSAISSSTSGQTVEILSGTFNESVTILSKSNIAIKGQGIGSTTISGTITANSSNNLNLSGFTCQGVSLNNCNSCTEYLNIVSSGGGYTSGLYVYNTTLGSFAGNISNASFGFNSVASTHKVFCPEASNTNINNNGYAVYATNSSNFELYKNGSGNVLGLCGNVNYEFYAISNAYVKSTWCSFPIGGIRKYQYSGGLVDIISPGICSLSKSNNNEEYVQSDNNSKDPTYDEFYKVNIKYLDLSRIICDDNFAKGNFDKKKFKEDFKNVIDDFTGFIIKNPHHNLSKTALTTVTHCLRLLDDYEAIKLLVQNIESNKNLTNLSGLSKRIMFDYYINEMNFESALNTADQIIKGNSDDTTLICDAIYAKGLLYQYNLNKKEEAINCYEKIIKDFSDKGYISLASFQLENLGQIVERETKQVSINKDCGINISNFPNPFNPITTIYYYIPKDGKVTLRVFDILGREVITLVNENIMAGHHNVVWEGKDKYGTNVTSGIYFYNINYDEQTITKKMMLVK